MRWRLCLVLAMLLLPARSDSNVEENDEQLNGVDGDDDDDEGPVEKDSIPMPGRHTPVRLVTPNPILITRTVKRGPLECYTCAYKSETPLRSCLDPSKHKVHSTTCHSVDDKCFTSVISKDDSLESVMRGCRSTCIGSTDTTCCELNRCNNQAFAMPLVPLALASTNKSTKAMQPTVLFFVTVLLVLQTVVKVSFV